MWEVNDLNHEAAKMRLKCLQIWPEQNRFPSDFHLSYTQREKSGEDHGGETWALTGNPRYEGPRHPLARSRFDIASIYETVR